MAEMTIYPCDCERAGATVFVKMGNSHGDIYELRCFWYDGKTCSSPNCNGGISASCIIADTDFKKINAKK
jgi:hypothetical protein